MFFTKNLITNHRFKSTSSKNANNIFRIENSENFKTVTKQTISRLFSACCNGDTWASELGSVLSRSEPYLITTFKKVPRGTNGGISLIGSLASILGGTFVGLAFYVGIILGSSKIAFIESSSQYQFDVIFIGSLAGFMGSLIDSLLGKV